MAITNEQAQEWRKKLAEAATAVASELEFPVKWVAVGANGHAHDAGSVYVYTSDAPPVEANAYDRQCAVTTERDELARALRHTDKSTAERIAEIDALVAEVQRLRAQLAQEQDAAKRHAAYIASCVDSDGCYRP